MTCIITCLRYILATSQYLPDAKKAANSSWSWPLTYVIANVSMKLYFHTSYISHHNLTTIDTFQVFKHVLMNFVQRCRSFCTWYEFPTIFDWEQDLLISAIYINFSGYVIFIPAYIIYGLRATSSKVAGSIPDGFIEVFNWRNPSGRTIALGLTRPLTEMSTRNNSCG